MGAHDKIYESKTSAHNNFSSVNLEIDYMYRMILTVISLVLVLESGSVFAEGIAGFDQLQWKMTKSQVQKSYPNFYEWVEEHVSPVNSAITGKVEKITNHMFGLKEYNVVFCKMKLNLDFVDDQLEGIVFSREPIINDDCGKRLKEGLNNKYGMPTKSSKPTSGVESLEWNKRDLQINLTIYYEGSLSNEIFLRYSDPGIYKKWILKQIEGNL